MKNLDTKSIDSRPTRKTSGKKRARPVAKRKTAARKSRKGETFALNIFNQLRKAVDSTSLKHSMFVETALKWMENSPHKIQSLQKKVMPKGVSALALIRGKKKKMDNSVNKAV